MWVKKTAALDADVQYFLRGELGCHAKSLSRAYNTCAVLVQVWRSTLEEARAIKARKAEPYTGIARAYERDGSFVPLTLMVCHGCAICPELMLADHRWGHPDRNLFLWSKCSTGAR